MAIILMFVVYILKSVSKNKYYIGHTKDVYNRLAQHNAGEVKSTKPYRIWEIIHMEQFETKQLAYKREMQIKSYKGGRAFKELIDT